MQPYISCGLPGQRRVPDFYSELSAFVIHAAWAGLLCHNYRSSSAGGSEDGHL